MRHDAQTRTRPYPNPTSALRPSASCACPDLLVFPSGLELQPPTGHLERTDDGLRRRAVGHAGRATDARSQPPDRILLRRDHPAPHLPSRRESGVTDRHEPASGPCEPEIELAFSRCGGQREGEELLDGGEPENRRGELQTAIDFQAETELSADVILQPRREIAQIRRPGPDAQGESLGEWGRDRVIRRS
jgi:hypothetical protein